MVRDTRVAVGAAFAAQGFGYACVVTAVPALKSRFDLGADGVSVALLTVVLCAALGSVLADAVAVRRSSRVALCAGLLTQAAGLVVVVVAPDLWIAAVGAVAYGTGLGAVDAANNMQGVLVQRRGQHEIFGRLYAVATAASVMGALTASAAARAELPVASLVAAIVVAVLVVGWGARFLDPARAAHEPHDDPGSRPRLPVGGILVVGGMVFAVFVADSAVAAWSTVYLSDSLEASAAVAPLAFACYQAVVLVTRLSSDVLTDRLGRRVVALAGLVLGAAGSLLVALVPRLPAAFVGFGLLGVAAGVLVPIAFSAAGDLAPSRSDEVVARVNLFNYAGALVGAVSLGLVPGEDLGIAFLLPAAVLVLGLPVIGRVPPRLRTSRSDAEWATSRRQ